MRISYRIRRRKLGSVQYGAFVLNWTQMKSAPLTSHGNRTSLIGTWVAAAEGGACEIIASGGAQRQPLEITPTWLDARTKRPKFVTRSSRFGKWLTADSTLLSESYLQTGSHVWMMVSNLNSQIFVKCRFGQDISSSLKLTIYWHAQDITANPKLNKKWK